MKIIFDTNVVLDIILQRAGAESALQLAQKIAAEEINGMISANSITDIYYVARKSIGDQKAREVIADILALFDVAAVDGDICSMALSTPMSDYEDAVLAVCAAEGGADYIATGDQGFLNADSPVPVKNPDKLLEMIEEGDSR